MPRKRDGTKSYTGTICRKCGETARYFSSGACVACQNSPEKRKAQKITSSLWRSSINGRATTLFNDAKRRALKHSKVFSINLEFVKKLMRENSCCQQTGDILELSVGTNTRNPYAPSLDQIVAGKGYTAENTQLVAGWYNRMKGDLSDTVACNIIKNTKLRSQNASS